MWLSHSFRYSIGWPVWNFVGSVHTPTVWKKRNPVWKIIMDFSQKYGKFSALSPHLCSKQVRLMGLVHSYQFLEKNNPVLNRNNNKNQFYPKIWHIFCFKTHISAQNGYEYTNISLFFALIQSKSMKNILKQPKQLGKTIKTSKKKFQKNPKMAIFGVWLWFGFLDRGKFWLNQLAWNSSRWTPSPAPFSSLMCNLIRRHEFQERSP